MIKSAPLIHFNHCKQFDDPENMLSKVDDDDQSKKVRATLICNAIKCDSNITVCMLVFTK